MSTIVLPEIQVVPYKAEYAELFRILNETWIKKVFFPRSLRHLDTQQS